MRERDPSIETLRRAADQVARELPRSQSRAPSRARLTLRLAVAAAALVLVVIVPPLVYELTVSREVEVEMMRVDGRDVPTRVIDDSEAGVFLVRPAPALSSTRRGAAMALTGDLP